MQLLYVLDASTGVHLKTLCESGWTIAQALIEEAIGELMYLPVLEDNVFDGTTLGFPGREIRLSRQPGSVPLALQLSAMQQIFVDAGLQKLSTNP